MFTNDPRDPAAAVRTLGEELTKLIDLARTLVEAGRAIDLAGLDDQIGLLCAKSLDLPPDKGRGMRPLLIVLSRALDALSVALAARAAECSDDRSASISPGMRLS